MKKSPRTKNRYFSSFPWYLYGLLFGSIGIVVFQELILFKLPSAFSGAYELGQILEKLLLSFASGTVFFFLTSHFPKQLKKSKVRVVLHNAKFNQVHMIDSIVYSILAKAQLPISPKSLLMTEAELSKILTPNITNSSIVFSYDNINYPTLLSLMAGVQDEFLEFYNLVVPYLEYLEVETLEAMNGIMNYLVILHNPKRALKSNTSFAPSIFASTIYNCLRFRRQYKM